MTIDPIRQSVEVKAPPARAFELFASRMTDWWPRGRTIGANPHAEIVVEPRAGGAWYERDAEGKETRWGTVLAWEPPARLLLSWQIDASWRYDAALATELELSFAPTASGGTRVTLEHRDLQRFADAAHVETLRNGWPGLLAAFLALAESDAALAPPSAS